MTSFLPDFLPGQLTLQRGSARDYLALQQFHYLPRRPATWAGVWSVRYSEKPAELPLVSLVEPCSAAKYQGSRVAAVGVLSYPVPSCKARERYFARQGSSRRENLEFINQNLRTISRVIVHPQFRSLGLASIIVRYLCENCPTRYVEALAVMGRAHPFFEKAGMTRIDPKKCDEPLYFIFDRNEEIAYPEETHNESQAGPLGPGNVRAKPTRA